MTTPGTAIITISSPGQFSSSAGSITLGDLTASVPDNAPYGSKEILQITKLSVFDDSATPQPLPSVAQDAIHIAAYFGDTNDDQSYNTPDVTLEQRYIGLINNGFPAFPLADPTLIGDITGNGLIQANDTTSIQRVIGLVNVPNVPALPTGLPAAPSGGPDPTIFIPNVSGNPGDTVTVPVEMTVTEASGITVSGFEIAIEYDPTKFTVGAVAQLGSMFSASLGFSPYLTFPAPGELIFQAESPVGTDTIPYNTTTDLFTLSFTVNASATVGTSVINLMQNIQTATTAIFDDNLNQLTLSPAPTNSPTDSVDGTFGIGEAVLDSIAVTPVAPSVALGLTEQFVATGTYSDGTTENLSSQVTWVSATTGVASINDTGLASTLSMGSTVITATLGNVTSPEDTLTVTAAVLSSIAVTPLSPSVAKGLSEQFVATGTKTDGTTEDLTSQVVWASATPSVATISDTGLASTLAVGTTNITATFDALSSAPDTLTVTPPALTSIAVTPVSPSVAKGQTEQFFATGTYTDGTTGDITNLVVWASATPAVATISGSGLASTLAVGTTNITGSLDGVMSLADTLTVTPATLTSIALTPVNPSVAKGLTEQFTATGTYTDNSTEVLTSGVVWASATPSVATISTSGLATTLAVGTTNITATVGNVASPVDTLMVTPATLTSIALTPVNPSVAKGLTEQFTATGTYTDNSTEVLTSGVAWASATPSVATINTSGLASTLAVGMTNITATVGNVTSPVDTLTVTPATLTSIALTPVNPSVARGLTEQFTATGTYTDNSTEVLTSGVVWASATPSVATISTSGLASTLAVGTTNITATVGNVTSPVDTLTVTHGDIDIDRVDAGIAERSQGSDRAVHGDGDVYGQLDGGAHERGGVGVGDAVRGDDQHVGPGIDIVGGHDEHHGDGRERDQSRGHADGDTRDTDVDRVDACQSERSQGPDGTIHGDGDLHGQLDGGAHERGGVGVGDAVRGHDQHVGPGIDADGGDDEHHGDGRECDQCRGHADGEHGDTDIDCVDAGQSERSQGSDRAVHGDGDVYGQLDGGAHERSSVGVGDAVRGDDQQFGPGDDAGRGNDEHHGDGRECDQCRGHADGEHGDTDIDRVDAGQSERSQGSDRAVHGDGDVYGQLDGGAHERGGVGVGDAKSWPRSTHQAWHRR